MRRGIAADQRGMTLVETMLALALSVMLVLPMLGWAQVAMQQQVAVRDRNLAGTSLGLLRTYFLQDVATAHRAVVDGDELVDCDGGDGSGGTPLLTLTRNDQRIVYSIAPTDESDAGLWRRVCDTSGRGASGSPLVEAVNPKVTDATCEHLETQQVLRLFRDELAAPADQAAAGRTAAEEQTAAEKAAVEKAEAERGVSIGCRRVELRVSTPALDQVVLSAVVRADGDTELIDEVPVPDIVLGADPQSGPAALRVQFTSKGSTDPRGGRLSFAWDFGDGATSSEADPVHVYERPGDFTAVLTATNDLGASARASVVIRATNNAPVAVIAAPANDTSAFRGELVRFSSKGSNDDADAGRDSRIVAWAWDFGDGTTSTEPDPVKAYDRLRPEGYPVTLTVTDSDGGTGVALIFVRVVNRIPTVQIVANRTSGTTPLSVDFSSVVVDESTMAVNPALTYAWDFGNGTTSTLADPPATTYTGAGSRTVRLTVTDDAGATASATQVITVTAPAGVPAPSNLRMTNSGVEQGQRFAEFAWDRVENARGYQVFLQCVNCGDTATGQETGTTVRIRGLSAARNTYTAQVRSRDAAGNWGPWSASITVRP